MKEFSVFHFEKKNCRTVEIEHQPWWIGKDVCKILGYKNFSDAIKTHCRGVVKYYPIIDSLGRTQNVRIINEPDLYRLIGGSTLPEAQRFESWIYEEVLPQIRKTGSYLGEGMIAVNAKQYEQIENLLIRSEKSLKFLTYEKDRLYRENLLLNENLNLRKHLAKKNTPLTEQEKETIQMLGTTKIARIIQRSPSTVRRALNKGGTR